MRRVLALGRARGGVARPRRRRGRARPAAPASAGAARPLSVGRARYVAQHGDQARRAPARGPALEGLPPLVGTPTGSSFPSAHATRRSRRRARTRRLLPAAAAVRAGAARWRSRACTSACTTRPTSLAGAALGHGGRERRAMKVGIVGMPNAGKSSLFNALTRAGAEAANYPFTTIEPNVAVVPVADERLDAVAATRRRRRESCPTRSTSTTSPGLVARRARGRGAGQPVPRQHPRDRRDRARRARARRRRTSSTRRAASIRSRDIETIETELIYADLEQAERRLERVEKQARGGDKAAIAEEAWLREVIAALQAGRPARTVPAPARRARRAARPARR